MASTLWCQSPLDICVGYQLQRNWSFFSALPCGKEVVYFLLGKTEKNINFFSVYCTNPSLLHECEMGSSKENRSSVHKKQVRLIPRLVHKIKYDATLLAYLPHLQPRRNTPASHFEKNESPLLFSWNKLNINWLPLLITTYHCNINLIYWRKYGMCANLYFVSKIRSPIIVSTVFTIYMAIAFIYSPSVNDCVE